jgi:hypothetical protein
LSTQLVALTVVVTILASAGREETRTNGRTICVEKTSNGVFI